MNKELLEQLTRRDATTLERTAALEIQQLHEAANKAERRAIMFGDCLHQQILAMRASMVDAVLNGPEAGMAWIENTLDGPGNLPDIEAARKEGGAQCMFNREMAEHEAFRAAHPTPNCEVSGLEQGREAPLATGRARP